MKKVWVFLHERLLRAAAGGKMLNLSRSCASSASGTETRVSAAAKEETLAQRSRQRWPRSPQGLSKANGGEGTPQPSCIIYLSFWPQLIYFSIVFSLQGNRDSTQFVRSKILTLRL